MGLTFSWPFLRSVVHHFAGRKKKGFARGSKRPSSQETDNKWTAYLDIDLMASFATRHREGRGLSVSILVPPPPPSRGAVVVVQEEEIVAVCEREIFRRGIK